MDMSDRPTPETDAEVDAEMLCACYPNQYVDAEFARKLERERDDLLQELEEYRSIAENIGAKKAVSEKEKAIRERDEARSERNQLKSLNESYAACWDEIKNVLNESNQGDKTCDLDRVLKAIRERDEAREALRTLAEHGESEIQRLTKERDEAILRRMETIMQCELYKQEHDEARMQIKELIYIAERSIALAEIDFENDKFGVVSELREGLEKIKEGAK